MKKLILFLLFIFIFLCGSCNIKSDNISDLNDEDDETFTPGCGNGIIEKEEICDSSIAGCSALDPSQYRTGFAKCLPDCSGFDKSKCGKIYVCGNSIVEPDEICDSNYKLCSEIDPEKFAIGFAPCYKYCNGWDSSKCKDFHKCGNGLVESIEVCELDSVKNCMVLNPAQFSSGQAHCNEFCSEWDYSTCKLKKCEQIECGQITEEIENTPYIFNCGTCSGGEICNSQNKCEFPCAQSKCGEVKIFDSEGTEQSFKCRTCPALQYCDNKNQCQQACSDMACGTDNGINCGSCPDGYYCGPFPNRCKSMPIVEFQEIPGGNFYMGCNTYLDNACNEAEKPYHIVELSPYLIGTYEVTVEQYNYCIDSGICNVNSKDSLHYRTYSTNYRCNIDSKRELSQPANCISYFGAEAFCKFIGGRLPTEAEWEKAARGGCEFYENCEEETVLYPWGNNIATCDNSVIIDVLSGIPGCETGGTMPVGSKPAGKSSYGIYDMAGNVWEWCSDWFDIAYYSNSPLKDPQGPESGREKVLKGGSCNFSWHAVRPSYRYNVSPNMNYTFGGFRCVKDISE